MKDFDVEYLGAEHKVHIDYFDGDEIITIELKLGALAQGLTPIDHFFFNNFEEASKKHQKKNEREYRNILNLFEEVLING